VAKEKEVTAEMKSQIDASLLEADLRNLKDSCKVGKKISEF
jgi:hypothetical protein